MKLHIFKDSTQKACYNVVQEETRAVGNAVLKKLTAARTMEDNKVFQFCQALQRNTKNKLSQELQKKQMAVLTIGIVI